MGEKGSSTRARSLTLPHLARHGVAKGTSARRLREWSGSPSTVCFVYFLTDAAGFLTVRMPILSLLFAISLSLLLALDYVCGRERELHTRALARLAYACARMVRRNPAPRLAGAPLSFAVLVFGDLCSNSVRYGNLNQLGLQVCRIFEKNLIKGRFGFPV